MMARVPGEASRCASWRCLLLAATLVGGVAVTDGAAQTVTLSVAQGTSLTEDGGNQDITLTARVSPPQTTDTTVTLSLGGTARATDYNVAGSLPTITIEANRSQGVATLVLSPVDDSFFEGGETIVVNGSATGLDVAGVSVDLNDNEQQPAVSLTSQGLIILTEGESVSAELALVLEGAVFEDDQEFTIDAVEDLSEEFTASPALPATATIEAGHRSVVIRFDFSAVDDTDVEATPVVYLYAATTLRGTLLKSGPLRALDIRDNDLVPAVHGDFVMRPREIASDGPPVTMTVSVNLRAALTEDATFTVTPQAPYDTWIQPRSATIHVPAGVRSGSAAFTVTPQAVDSPQVGTFDVDWSPDTLDIRGLGRHSFFIEAVGVPYVISQLKVYSWSSREAFTVSNRMAFGTTFSRTFAMTGGSLRLHLDSGPVDIPCVYSRGNPNRVSCEYRIENGQYDFDKTVEVRPGALQIAAWHHPDDEEVTWPVPVIPDRALALPIPFPIYGGTYGIDLHVAPQSLQEGIGPTPLTITALNAKRRILPVPIDVPLMLASATATDADYEVTGPLRVTIPAGEIEGRTTVTVTPVDDFVKENRVETVRVEGDMGTAANLVRGADLRIIDAPNIELSLSAERVGEDGGPATMTLTAALGDPSDSVRPRPIPVALTWRGTAGSGDYTVSGDSVTIPANARSGTATVTITPTDDRLLEGDETIELRGTTPGLTVVGTELTLADDEEVPAVELAVTPESLLESDGARTVTVSATLDPEVAMANDVTTVNLELMGSATLGTDYTRTWTPATPTISIPLNETEGSSTVTLTLAPQDDDLAEGDETIVVEGTATTGSRGLVLRVATITLQDDDVRGVQVEPTRLTVDEGDSGEYRVRLTSQPESDVTVSVAAPANVPLEVQPTALTFTTDNWGTEQTVTVTVEDDSDALMHEDVELTHTVGGGGYAGVTAAPVTVTLRETTVPQMTIGDEEDDEAAGNLTFTVELDVASSAEVTASWATAGVSATAGADYTESSDTVRFPPGSTSQTVTVPIVDDDLDEEDETFTVTLGDPQNAGLADGEATGTISDDDDEPALTLIGPAQAAREGEDRNLEFTVTLEPASGREVTVVYATGDGTAVSPGDFTAPADDAVLTFAAGERSKTITIPVVDDTVDEDEETFTFRLSQPQGATISTGAATGVIVDDDDEPVLAVEDEAEREDAGDLVFTVTLEPASGREVTVAYVTSDGTATEPADYAQASGMLTFAAEETSQTIEVPLVDDAVDEAPETFTLTLSSPANAGFESGTTLAATGTITDDDAPPTVSVGDETAEEDAGDLVFTVMLEPASGREVTVAYATSDGTATEPADYTRTSGTLTFAAGLTSRTVAVPIVDDTADEEEDEVFTFTLSGPANAMFAGDASTLAATGTITDDDDPAVEVSFGAETYTADEGGSPATVTVELNLDPEREVTVPLTAANQGGAEAADYSGVPAEVVFTAGGPLFRTFDLTAADDGVDDDGESVLLGFGPALPDGVAAASPTEATLTLGDDDERGVEASAAALSVNESASTSYTLVLTSEPTGPVTVTVTGTDGTDLTAPAEGLVLTFTAANWDQPQTVMVTAADDPDVLADAPVVLSHAVAGGDYGDNSVSAPPVTVTIVENDTATVSVMDESADEGAGYVEFTVTLSEQSSAPVTMDYETSDGSATQPDDYTVTGGRLTFEVPAVSQTLRVPVVDDTQDEAETETFTLTLSNVAQAAFAGGGSTLAATGTIEDNDDPAVEVSFGAATYSASEGGSPVTVTVSLNVDPERDVVIPLTVTPGNGAVEADYSGVPEEVRFTAGGVLSRTFAVTAVDDMIDDDGETVVLGFAALPERVSAASPETSTVTLVDDDVRGVAVSRAELTIPEGDSDSYTVVLSSRPTENVTVTVGGAAGAPLTLAPAGLTLTFAPDDWDTPQTVTVTAAADDDAVVPPDVTLTHAVTGGDYASVSAPDVTVRVTERTVPALTISPAAVSVAEGVGGTGQSFTVTLNVASSETVTVAYSTADGAATAGADYTTTAGTLTFGPGAQLAQAFSVPILQDTLDEDDETFTVALSDPVNATAGSAATVTITDDDALPTLNLPSGFLAPGESVGTFNVTVSLSAASGREVRVKYSSYDGGRHPSAGAAARAGEDYTAVTGVLTFAPGQRERTFGIPITNDDLHEGGRESFRVALSEPVNAETGSNDATVFIVDDDSQPRLDIAPATVAVGEGDAVRLEAQLSVPSGLPVHLRYRTEDVTATAGDYTATSGWVNLQIPAGETSRPILVATTNDALDEEDDETFRVTIAGRGDPALNASFGTRVSTVTISDDDDAPGLRVADPTAGEGAGSLVFTVSLDAESGKTVTVNYAVSAVTATSGVDFTPVPAGTLTFEPGTTEQTVAVPIIDDEVHEPDETLQLTLSGAVNGTSPATPATGTIDDDEALPVVTLGLDPSSVSEDGGSSTVTASLSGASSEAVTVTVTAAADSPAVSGDFTQSATTLTIAAGSTASTGTVTLTAVDNAVDAPDRTVTVSGSVTGGNGVSAPSSQTLTITDDEATPTVALVLSPSSIGEDAGVSTVTAALSGTSSQAVVVTVSAAAVSPAVSGDFTLSGATLTIAAGQTTSTGTVTITGVNNSVDAPDKTVTVSGSVTGGNGVSAPSAATLTITDDEATPTVALVLSPSAIGEDAGVSTVTAALSGTSSQAVVVTVSAAAVSPAVSGDFTLSGTTLTIAAGQTTSTGTVTITGVNNSVDAPDKTVTVSGSVTGGNGVSAPSAATLTITDDEATPTVALVLSPSSVGEDGGSSGVTATLSGASSASVVVTVSASAVSPAVSGDFTLSGATLTIAAGRTTSTGTVTITGVDNAVDAPDKTVTVSGSVTGGHGVSAPSDATLTITDDEMTPTVALVLSPSAVGEDGGSSGVTATLSGASSASVVVTVSASAVSPAVSGDFTLSGATLTIAAGQTTSTGTVTITGVDNAVDAPDKTVTVSGSVTGGHGVSAPSDATLTITDDEATPTVALVLSPSSVGEDGGSSGVTATLSGASSASVVVTVSASAVSPAVSGDFTLSGTTLTIAAGQTTSTGTVTITGVDNAVDAPDKTVTVSGSVTGGHGVSAPSSQTLTITDDETTPVVALVLSPSAIGEDGGSSTVTATLSGASSASVVVTVSASAVSPAVSGDFTLAGATLTIASGQTTSTGTVTITAVNNAVDAPDKTVTVSGSVTAGHGVSAPSSQTLTITDDEGAPTLSLVLSPSSIGENGGVSTVTATLSGASSASAVVTVSASAVSPAVSGDFTLAGATLTITAGQTTSTGDGDHHGRRQRGGRAGQDGDGFGFGDGRPRGFCAVVPG